MRGVGKGQGSWLLVLFRLGFVALLVAGCGPNSSSFSTSFGDGVSARSADFFIRIEAAYRGSLPATAVDPYVENMRAAYVRIVDDYARSLDGEAVAERAVAALRRAGPQGYRTDGCPSPEVANVVGSERRQPSIVWSARSVQLAMNPTLG